MILKLPNIMEPLVVCTQCIQIQLKNKTYYLDFELIVNEISPVPLLLLLLLFRWSAVEMIIPSKCESSAVESSKYELQQKIKEII